MAVSIIPENPSQQWKATELELSQLHENSKWVRNDWGKTWIKQSVLPDFHEQTLVFFPVLGEIGGAKVGQPACNFHTNLGLRSWGSWMSISSRYWGIYYIMYILAYIYMYLYLIEAGPTSFIIAPWWPCSSTATHPDDDPNWPCMIFFRWLAEPSGQ